MADLIDETLREGVIALAQAAADDILAVYEQPFDVEHKADDDYWGDGGDGSGSNHLGRILMAVRQAAAARP